MKTIKNAGKYHCAVLGVSYKTCSQELRDPLSGSLQDIENVLKSIRNLPGVSETVILSTCNRAEIYVATLYPEALTDVLVEWWAKNANVDFDALSLHCYYYVHGEAVKHLYEVVSSIDSLVLGENQILGQVRDAFLKAFEYKTTGSLLNHLFQSAISLGKQVREQTEIGSGTISIAHATLELVRKELKTLENLRIGILGLGEMGRLTATTFFAEPVSEFAFFNRTLAKAEKFAEEFKGKAYPLESLTQEIASLDILITCAAAPAFLLNKINVPSALRSKILIIDLGSPRNVDPILAAYPGITLYSIDDLKKVVERNKKIREEAAMKAKEFIDNASDDFKAWFTSKDLAPLLVKINQYHELVGDFVLKKYAKKTNPETFEILKHFENEFRKKLLHIPFEELKKLSMAGMGLESELVLEKLYSQEDFNNHFLKED